MKLKLSVIFYCTKCCNHVFAGFRSYDKGTKRVGHVNTLYINPKEMKSKCECNIYFNETKYEKKV